MNIKAIEINGSLIILEDVMAVSPLKKWKYDEEYHFQVDYKNGKGRVVFNPPNERWQYSGLGDGSVSICSDIPLERLREKIISIITE